MKDMSVKGTAALQQNQTQNQNQQAGQDAAPAEKIDRAASISSLLPEQEGESKHLSGMIREAQEKADAQREAMKIPNSTRYGDAPLEAYARLARAKTEGEVSSASGYARRTLNRFNALLRIDSENSAKIKAAINQLQKAIARGERKKRELSKEKLAELRRKHAARENQKQLELRLGQSLNRQKGQRMFRESGYSREAELSSRLASHLTATQIELRQQAQVLSTSAAATVEATAHAAQQYTATSEAAAAAPVEINFSGEA